MKYFIAFFVNSALTLQMAICLAQNLLRNPRVIDDRGKKSLDALTTRGFLCNECIGRPSPHRLISSEIYGFILINVVVYSGCIAIG